MAYSELIKSFDKIRDYMREFYVYGFKSREDYTKKSARSYDDERRRIESWLGGYMAFRHTAEGKNVFISVDNRSVTFNPLHSAWKAKSFTDKDIVLHFCVLDILADGAARSVGEITDAVADYLSHTDTPFEIDESTVRKKLKEYVELVSESSGMKSMVVFCTSALLRTRSIFPPGRTLPLSSPKRRRSVWSGLICLTDRLRLLSISTISTTICSIRWIRRSCLTRSVP